MEENASSWNSYFKKQRNINIDYKNIAGANHFFENKTEKLVNEVSKYLDSRLIGPDF